jgi:hypothetical protein
MEKTGNFFIDRDQVKIIDTRRIVYLITCILAFFLTEAGRFIYRPYIYEHHINDYGLADAVGNWGGVVVQIFLGLALLNSGLIKGMRLIGFIVAGYIVYEILQSVLPKGTFDWLDIYGTLIGGFFALVLFLMIHFSIRHNSVIFMFGQMNER